MRPVLMGLAVVASLAMALTGISVPRGVPPAVAMAQEEEWCGSVPRSALPGISNYECNYLQDEKEYSEALGAEAEQHRRDLIHDCLYEAMKRYGLDKDYELPWSVGRACYDMYRDPSSPDVISPAERNAARYYAEALRADAWAEEHLAAEEAVAAWWRLILPLDTEQLDRRGALQEVVPNGILGDALYPVNGRVGSFPSGEIVEYACDANYDDAQSGGCVPADRDYDCGELRSWGIANIPVIGEDWMLLDDDGDGLGCEPIVEPVAPTPEATKQCEGILGTLGCLLGR